MKTVAPRRVALPGFSGVELFEWAGLQPGDVAAWEAAPASRAIVHAWGVFTGNAQVGLETTNEEGASQRGESLAGVLHEQRKLRVVEPVGLQIRPTLVFGDAETSITVRALFRTKVTP